MHISVQMQWLHFQNRSCICNMVFYFRLLKKMYSKKTLRSAQVQTATKQPHSSLAIQKGQQPTKKAHDDDNSSLLFSFFVFSKNVKKRNPKTK